MNIRVDLTTPITDGTEVVFRSPVDCSQITGLIVYYNDDSKEFALADAHGNNVGDIDHLFAENVVVKVILDVTHGMAFVQNADTNAYIERTFVKSVNGVKPDENGNVEVTGGSGISVNTAEVGQTIVVKEVDENGKPTAWEAADFPTGGELKTTELISELVVEEEDVSFITVPVDINKYEHFQLRIETNINAITFRVGVIDKTTGKYYYITGNNNVSLYNSGVVDFSVLSNSLVDFQSYRTGFRNGYGAADGHVVIQQRFINIELGGLRLYRQDNFQVGETIRLYGVPRG